MAWVDFIGNAAVVEQLRQHAAAGSAQRTLVLCGPEGIGKTTLGLMLGLALNCQAPPQPGDFCHGSAAPCPSCARFTGMDSLGELAEQAVAWREQEYKSRGREIAPLVLAPHPAILVYPPDGDFLSMAQARAVMRKAQMTPDAGSHWCFLLPELEKARWMVQSALLKTLEEPPPKVALVALVRNPLELLPTVRSRALLLTLHPLPVTELAAELGRRGVGEAETAAHWAQGCPGRSLRLDLAAWRGRREEAWALLAAGLEGPRAAALFRVTETTRSDKEKFESLLEILYSVLQDIQYLQSGYPTAIRNRDCIPELTRLARQLTSAGVAQAVAGLDRIQAGARRNVNRPLALDAWAVELAGRAAN